MRDGSLLYRYHNLSQADDEMWVLFGIGGALAAVVTLTVLTRVVRGRSKKIDVGSVSDAWLAEQNRKTD
jgi:hypothetical protein